MYKKYCSDLASQSTSQSGKSNTQEKMSDLPELWKKLSEGESKSLLKKHCTKEVYEKLKDKKTKLGGTLADCIRSGKIKKIPASQIDVKKRPTRRKLAGFGALLQ